MKTFFSFLIFGIGTSISAQAPFSIGEVFNFEIGDEFHYTCVHLQGFPNGQRDKIIDKWYSPGLDSVTYVISYSNYWATPPVFPNPEWNYVFYEGTETVTYTNLESPVSSTVIPLNPEYCYEDTIGQTICDNISYAIEIRYCIEFEPFWYGYEFAPGLGKVRDYYWDMKGYSDCAMIYYLKGAESCGIPDLTGIKESTTSAPQISMELFPNPASDHLQIQFSSPLLGLAMGIVTDLSGKEVSREAIAAGSLNHTLRVDGLPPGLYVFRLVGVPAAGLSRTFAIE